MFEKSEFALLNRLVEALERLAPAPPPMADLALADAFVWQAESQSLQPIAQVQRIDLSLLKGIDRQSDILLENTRHFAEGYPANNALLWGARGMGKSSLVKAVHHKVAQDTQAPLKLIELHREDIATLPQLMQLLRRAPAYRFIIFCDDLSFDQEDVSYKSLKAALEGSLDGGVEMVVFYATSNRRHLMPRDMIENEAASAIAPSEAVQEKVSLSDRFGLWLGFHNCSQDEYLAMVEGYARHFKLPIAADELRAGALTWSVTRGSRSGRVAWQYIKDVAGQTRTKLASPT